MRLKTTHFMFRRDTFPGLNGSDQKTEIRYLGNEMSNQ